jgi:hypothetical protein
MKIKNRIWIYPLLAMGFLLMLGSSSKKDTNLPEYASFLNTAGTGKVEWVTICHKPCTRVQKTLVIPIEALAAHLSHGDVIGECGNNCCPTTETEYVISNSPDQGDMIYVDDILKVYINGSLVASVEQHGRCCPPMSPIHFIANTGDLLRIEAIDANRCYSLEFLWLQKADGSCLTQLTGDIFGPNCDSEPPNQTFFNQTFTLP